MWTVQFLLISLHVSGGYAFNISIQNYFSDDWEQIYQFSLKNNTTEANSAAIYFP